MPEPEYEVIAVPEPAESAPEGHSGAPGGPSAPVVVPDEPEGMTYLASGRVRVQWNGKVTTLRRPTFDELLTYHDHLTEVDEKTNAAAEAGKARFPAQAIALRDLMAWVFSTLGDNRLPDEGIPSWLPTLSTSTGLLSHWQTVPLLPGNA